MASLARLRDRPARNWRCTRPMWPSNRFASMNCGSRPRQLAIPQRPEHSREGQSIGNGDRHISQMGTHRFRSAAPCGLPAFKMTWCNRSPEGRARAETILGRKLDWGDAGEKKWKDYAGILISGSRGTMYSTGHNMSFTLMPEAEFKELLGPPRNLPRSPGHEREWLNAIRAERRRVRTSLITARGSRNFCCSGTSRRIWKARSNTIPSRAA